MITSVLIIAISAVLFVYWLRYSCLMLLRSARKGADAGGVSEEPFSVSSVQERLKAGADLGELAQTLDRDYRLVTYLIEHAAGLELASIENRLLVMDYRLMRLWSRVTRTVLPEQSRSALLEMAAVLSVLVAQMGEHSQIQMEA